MFADVILTVDLALLAFVAGTVVPILVGLLAKSSASSTVKGLLNLVLSAVAGVVAVAIDGGGVFTGEALVAAFFALVASVGMFYGVLEPTGVTPAVRRATARFGIGGPGVRY